MMRRRLALALVPGLLIACAGKTLPLGDTADGGGASGGNGATGGSGGTAGATGGSGGTAAMGGNGGSAGDTVAHDGGQATAKKLDLLLVVDNSASMADKQNILGESAQNVVDRLVNPRCVGQNGVYVSPQPASPNDPCPAGSTRELQPVTDMHVGVITSSLGGAGSVICTPQWSNWNPAQNDHGQLIGVTRNLPSYNGAGYLAWDPAGKLSPPGEKDSAALAASLKSMIQAAGELGCGYEATLESMYHFLADPAPWQDVQNVDNTTTPIGTDQELLAQRQAFLRPDSAVMVVVLTDENDCSVLDDGIGWVVGLGQGGPAAQLPAPTSICATDPDNKCCHSCGETDPPGCSHDPKCDDPAQKTLTMLEDSPNLRCFDTKRRFGIDLLYPTQRYANALRLQKICPANHDLWCGTGDTPVDNPLFAGGRSPSLVSFEVITGVPWQDVARKPDGSAPVSYMTANELVQNGRWSEMLGDLATRTPPTDPFMLESTTPRGGQNPVTGALIAPPSSAYDANDINGHEFSIPNRDDLEYACTFRLSPAKQCNTGASCDCTQPNDKPVCQDPATGSFSTTTQYAAKAYPGLREIDVARALGYKGVVASICASNTSDPAAQDYAYNPAVQAMIERLNRVLR